MSRFLGPLNAVGSIASVIALAYVFYEKQSVWFGLVLGIAVISSVAAIWVYGQSRPHRPWKTNREQLLEEGRKLIGASSSKVVMFGKDLSWAHDYADAIDSAVKRGATVTVICVEPAATTTPRMDTLEGLGAQIVRIKSDHGIRATLIDHDTQSAAKLFIATKVRLDDRDPSRVQYQCRTYHASADATLIIAMTHLSQLWIGNATTRN